MAFSEGPPKIAELKIVDCYYYLAPGGGCEVLFFYTVLHRDTLVWKSHLPALQSKLIGAAIVTYLHAIVTYRRGHRDLPARLS